MLCSPPPVRSPSPQMALCLLNKPNKCISRHFCFQFPQFQCGACGSHWQEAVTVPQTPDRYGFPVCALWCIKSNVKWSKSTFPEFGNGQLTEGGRGIHHWPMWYASDGGGVYTAWVWVPFWSDNMLKTWTRVKRRQHWADWEFVLTLKELMSRSDQVMKVSPQNKEAVHHYSICRHVIFGGRQGTRAGRIFLGLQATTLLYI